MAKAFFSFRFFSVKFWKTSILRCTSQGTSDSKGHKQATDHHSKLSNKKLKGQQGVGVAPMMLPALTAEVPEKHTHTKIAHGFHAHCFTFESKQTAI